MRPAFHRICCVDRDGVFVHVIPMHMMEMAIVKIVHIALMANRSVPAVRAMRVGVIGMMLFVAGRHDLCPLLVQIPVGTFGHRFCTALGHLKRASCSWNRNKSSPARLTRDRTPLAGSRSPNDLRSSAFSGATEPTLSLGITNMSRRRDHRWYAPANGAALPHALT